MKKRLFPLVLALLCLAAPALAEPYAARAMGITFEVPEGFFASDVDTTEGVLHQVVLFDHEDDDLASVSVALFVYEPDAFPSLYAAARTNKPLEAMSAVAMLDIDTGDARILRDTFHDDAIGHDVMTVETSTVEGIYLHTFSWYDKPAKRGYSALLLTDGAPTEENLATFDTFIHSIQLIPLS